MPDFFPEVSSPPWIIEAGGRETDPFRLLNPRDQARLRGKRILVVDDFNLDLNATVAKLSSVLTKTSGCEIAVTQDSDNAAKYILSEAKAGRPFDVVVLDCAMQEHDLSGMLVKGKNGDAVLKELAGYPQDSGFKMPAVVFHSGSHATGLHSWNYGEFGRMRVADGKKAEQHLDESIGGMPMMLVLKSASAGELVDAVSQMLRVRETASQKNFAGYLASDGFRVSVLETDYDSEQAAKVARVAHVITDKTGVFVREASELFPGFTETRVGGELADVHRELSGVKSFFQVFSEKGDVAAGVRHRYSNVIGHVESELAVVQGELTQGILQPPSGKSKEFAKLVDTFEAEIAELYTAFHSYRNLLDKSTAEEKVNLVYESRARFAMIRHNKGSMSFKDKEILVSGPRNSLETVLEQPAMNAVKFTDPENRKIDMEISKVKVGGLKPKVQQDLQKHGLTSNDDVACVVVRDNGCGIPPENIEKLGRGFTTGGTGIGLELLDTVIRQFKGAWDVESEVGRGTSFYMYFKIAEKA